MSRYFGKKNKVKLQTLLQRRLLNFIFLMLVIFDLILDQIQVILDQVQVILDQVQVILDRP
ncbi:hypothetical protein [Loigolactobacillus coryniformis]|uniref:hypothetical protein n=1 Tax=Loigolactobacillus coryniformis TaxID=1610 RepID=UPI00345C6D99